jgi:hypothetical protein
MTKKSDDDMPTTFPEKWMKVLKNLPEFKDTADAASEEELKKIIVQSEGNIYDVDKEMSTNVKLNSAKELVKDFMAPYKDARRSQNCKIQYALFLLEGKGVDLK